MGTYQVQRCYNGKERVCDTTHKIDVTSKDDYQCTNVESPNCYMEEKTIKDVTCTKTWEFECKSETPATEGDDPYPSPLEVCKTNVTRFCDKFTNVFPFTTKEQKCHFEPKKKCKEEPRQICDKVEKKAMVPVCEKLERMSCKYVPVEQCNTEKKEYCHKVEKVKVEEICDRRHATSIYNHAQRQGYY